MTSGAVRQGSEGISASALTLTGGASSRMGRNKALVPVGGVPLIQRVIRAVQPLVGEVLLIANDAETYTWLGLPCVPDQEPGYGPLMGLYSGLSACRGEVALLLACDMPFVNPDLLHYMTSQALGYDVVIPKTADGLHPLHAIYRRSTCLPAIAASLAAGQRRMIAFHGRVRVRIIDEAELRSWDPEGIALMNVNTPAELAAAEHIARRLHYQMEQE